MCSGPTSEERKALKWSHRDEGIEWDGNVEGESQSHHHYSMVW